MTTEQAILDVTSDTTASGVSWGSIFAGAAAAAALSLILLILGIGLGFPAISPWSNQGISVTAIGISSILWLTFTQIAASGVGGYLSGRLRIRWASVHSDEVYFRDTAHGLLAWAIASLITAALLGTVIGNVVSMGASAGTQLVSNAAELTDVNGATATNNMSAGFGRYGSGSDDVELAYWVDTLFRINQPPAETAETAETNYGLVWLEASRIFAKGLRLNNLPAEDSQYLTIVVAEQTGLSSVDAEKRVVNIFNKAHTEKVNAEQNAKHTADQVRKVTAYSALWIVVALMLGAFVASLAATFGGRQRDRVVPAGSTAFS